MYYGDDLTYSDGVALRKESVDRNDFPIVPAELTTVALRKESVDRNRGVSLNYKEVLQSLSARRAWIEMSISVLWMAQNRLVALRKESVDRNGRRDGRRIYC